MAYSYEEYPDSNESEQGLSPNSDDPDEMERIKYGRKFKTGDWVCFNHGDYPEYFTQDPWQITHWTFHTFEQKGSPMGRIHKTTGMSHSESFLRLAHPEEVAYYQAGLPHIYSKEKLGYDRVQISCDRKHFTIGNTFNSIEFINNVYNSRNNARYLITLLLDTGWIKDDAQVMLSKIHENLK